MTPALFNEIAGERCSRDNAYSEPRGERLSAIPRSLWRPDRVGLHRRTYLDQNQMQPVAAAPPVDQIVAAARERISASASSNTATFFLPRGRKCRQRDSAYRSQPGRAIFH